MTPLDPSSIALCFVSPPKNSDCLLFFTLSTELLKPHTDMHHDNMAQSKLNQKLDMPKMIALLLVRKSYDMITKDNMTHNHIIRN